MGIKRLIVGISGASGAPLAVELLRACKQIDVETHLIMTPGGCRTIEHETKLTASQVYDLADTVYAIEDIGAPPASGSWKTIGMVVIPCSMKTLAGIHSGYSDNLLLRAADVTLKEQRKLVLVPRECPLSPIHLRNQYELSLMGTVIMPPVLNYYCHPQSLDDLAKQFVGRVLDQFGIEYSGLRRWGESNESN